MQGARGRFRDSHFSCPTFCSGLTFTSRCEKFGNKRGRVARQGAAATSPTVSSATLVFPKALFIRLAFARAWRSRPASLHNGEGMSRNALAHQPAVPPTIPPTSLPDHVSRHPPACHPQRVRPRARSRACVRTGAGAAVATTVADVDLVACQGPVAAQGCVAAPSGRQTQHLGNECCGATSGRRFEPRMRGGVSCAKLRVREATAALTPRRRPNSSRAHWNSRLLRFFQGAPPPPPHFFWKW